MAGFRMHMTVSTVAGTAYGGVAYAVYGLPLPACVLAGGLCSVSGMIPDIDSGPGRPLHESLSFAAAVVSTMLVDRFQALGWAMESIILGAGGVYLLIRFALAKLLQHLTAHRGMFHSLPAAAIAGEVAFLLTSGDLRLRIYKAAAVVIGYMTHLVLDEIYSVEVVRGKTKLKRSFGTAVKLFGHNFLANAFTYAALAGLTFLTTQEPGWMSNVYHQQLQQTAQRWAEQVQSYSSEALARISGPGQDPAAQGTPSLDRDAPTAIGVKPRRLQFIDDSTGEDSRQLEVGSRQQGSRQ
jgi:membrane-bound metal-dependent hydrolase YbcI (DUF457 family)